MPTDATDCNKVAFCFGAEADIRELSTLSTSVPTGSPSRGGIVAGYIFDINQPSLPTPLKKNKYCSVFVSASVFMALSTVFYSINSSQKLSAFLLCSSGLISALLVLSTTYFFMKVSLSPDILLCG